MKTKDKKYTYTNMYLLLTHQNSSINRIEPAHQGDMQARYPEIAINVSHRVRKEERQAWVWEDVCEGDWMRTTKQRGKVVKVTAISDARIPKEEILFFLLDGSSHLEATADSNNNNNNNNNAIRRWGDGRKGKLIEEGLEVESVTGPIEHVVGGRIFYGYEVKAKINVLCKNLLVCAGLKHFGSDVVLGHSVCFRTHDNGRKRKRTKGIDDPSVERKHSDRKGGVAIIGGGENGTNNNGNNNNNGNGHLTDNEESGGSTPEGRTPPSGSESAEDLHKDHPPMFHVLKMENASSSPHYPPPPMPALSFAENRNANLYPTTTTTTTTTSSSLPSVQRSYPAQNVQGNPLYMRSELPSTSNRHSDYYYPEHMPYSCENVDARKSFPEPYSYSANQEPILDPTTAYLAQRVKNSLHAYGMEVSGDLRVDGIVRAHGFAQYSDMRLKTNIAEITDALEMVTQLKGKTYSWKPGSEMAEKDGRARILGFLAQEVKRGTSPAALAFLVDGIRLFSNLSRSGARGCTRN